MAFVVLFVIIPLALFAMDGYLFHDFLHETRYAVQIINQLDGHYAHMVNHGVSPTTPTTSAP